MTRRGRAGVGLAALAAVVIGAALLAMYAGNLPTGRDDNGSRASNSAKTRQELFEIPPVRESRFLNTSQGAAYIGGQACAECHADEHRSYLATTHSRALGDVELANEPPDVAFHHPDSGRDYRVYRKDGEMRHRESIRVDGGEFVLADYPIRYAIGSGHHSRSYLVENDGFLLESPVTWYAAKDAWGMSPGFDRKFHAGFERTADIGCLYCHAGRVAPADGGRFRVRLHEQAISCESCHGPGSLHVKRHREGATPGAAGASDEQGADLTIVHPDRLAREENEAVCAQCHLRGDASVVIRGRDVTDFRPGLHLSDFRADYVLRREDRSMKVVGHVEQMRASVCYQQDTNMTCTTCHDPHFQPEPEERLEYFRQKCLQCHEEDSCGLAMDARLARHPNDNCMACHMPKGDTDIPHFAFTHHRIGLHDLDRVDEHPASTGIGKLVPLHDLDHLPRQEQSRCLGLAYMELADKQASSTAFDEYRTRAVRLLESVWQDGLQDGEVAAALGRVYWEEGDLRRAIFFANAATHLDGPPGADANALFVLGDAFRQLNEPEKALPPLRSLVRQRRQSEDWVLIGICERARGRLVEATQALETAVEISPTRIDARLLLAELYEMSGKPELAKEQRETAALLSEQTGQP